MIPFRRMSPLVRYEVRDRVAVITVDNPPVNALSAGVPEGISEAVERACGDSAADAIVLIGAGTTFIAGADINVFKQLKTREQSIERSQARARATEDAGRRRQAARCRHSRSCARRRPRVRHGLSLPRGRRQPPAWASPKCTSGSFPARAAPSGCRACAALALALEMCTGGKPVAATQRPAGGHRRRRDRRRAAGRRHRLRESARRGGGAPPHPRSAGQESAIAPRASPPARPCAPRSPRRRAARARRSPRWTPSRRASPWISTQARDAKSSCSPIASCRLESKAMRHLFFAEREAGRIPDVPRDTPTRTIARAAIVGAGTMGGGIAMAYANAGIPVLLKDVDHAALDRGMSVIRKNYASTMAKGRMTPEAMERTLALITPTTALRRLRRRRHRRGGGVREHGPEEVHLRRARRGDKAGRHSRVEHLDARHRRACRGERPARHRSSGTTSSAPPT